MSTGTDTRTAIIYRRVSTGGQAESGAGLDAQYAQCAAYAVAHGVEVVAVATDAGATGTTTAHRPALAQALDLIAQGDADTLIVAKLDRLSRSITDAVGLIDRARTEGWSLAALDIGLDVSTAAGGLVAGVLASVAQWEARAIGERTAAALQARKAAGVRLGRPVTLPESVRERIAREHAAGGSLSGIARALTAEGVPTARGGAKWYPSTVRAVLASLDLDAEAERAAA